MASPDSNLRTVRHLSATFDKKTETSPALGPVKNLKFANSDRGLSTNTSTGYRTELGAVQGQNVKEKAQSDEDEIGKSSLGGVFEAPGEAAAISPVSSRISQFQNAATASTIPVPLNPNRRSKSVESSPITSPSVAALQMQLNLQGRPRLLAPSSASGKLQSSAIRRQYDAEAAETKREPDEAESTAKRSSSNLSLELNVSSLSDVGMLPTLSTRSSNRISELQKRLVLDPTMLFPTPKSGPPSHKSRLKSQSATHPVIVDVDKQNDAQLNRPVISKGSRRRRQQAARFFADSECNEAISEIEQMVTRLEEPADQLEDEPAPVVVALQPSSNLNPFDAVDPPPDDIPCSTNNGPIIIAVDALPDSFAVGDNTASCHTRLGSD